MPISDEIPFRQLLDALLDEDTPFNPRYLYRLSDLNQVQLSEFEATWNQVSAWRRQALMEDLEVLGESDYLFSFEAIGRLGLRDNDPRVRATAVRLLWDYEDRDLAAIYIELMDQDSDANVRAAAASALGKFVYMGEVDELPENLRHEIENRLLRITKGHDESLVRRRALESLGYSSLEEVSQLIEDAYDSGQREWIATALYAMGRSANDRWNEYVLEMIDSPFPIIRAEAARAAGELEISGALSSLMDLLDDANVDVRSAAIWSLTQIGGAGVRETLEEMQEQTDDEEEAEFLETALDNLAFTEEMEIFTLFDLSGEPKPIPDADPAPEPELLEAFGMMSDDEIDDDLDDEDLYLFGDEELDEDDLYFAEEENLEDDLD